MCTINKRLLIGAAFAVIMANGSAQKFVHTNQVGYNTQSSKLAMVVDKRASKYVIKDAKTDADVYRGVIAKSHFWRDSNEEISWADFSGFVKEGEYYVQVGDDKSPNFKITAKGAYDDVLVWATKGFYLWRSGMPIESQFATFQGRNYARPAGHTDKVVYLHSSLATPERHADMELDLSGGWYDAGDFGKYTVNAAITLHALLTAYDANRAMFDTLSLNIPESGNNTPDILDECMYELKWMLKMQDPNDGGVYNKVTALKFPEMIMPHKDKDDRYVVGKSTDCAYDFAATMALASRMFEGNLDYPDFSAKALDAAKKAYEFAAKKGEVYFSNPADCFTGEYSCPDQNDEKFWANTELLITTKDKKYAAEISFFQMFNVPFWGDVRTVALTSMFVNRDKLAGLLDIGAIERKYRAVIDNLLSIYNFSPGKVPIHDFYWGSNGQVTNAGALLAIGAKFFNMDKYWTPAQYCYDYILGANTTGYSFLTGFGETSPMNIHDRRSADDGVNEPLPGYVVGGPHLQQTTDCGKNKYPSNKYPARAYLDEICSYSTNEIAINWNAPFVLLTAMLKSREK